MVALISTLIIIKEVAVNNNNDNDNNNNNNNNNNLYNSAAPSRINHSSTNQTVNENDTIYLNCTAEGLPTPVISWTRKL